MSDTAFHSLPDGRRIAHRFNPGSEPALVFLPGYMSDMAGSKACALFDHATAAGRACLLLDYSGCGNSDGDFAQGTLTRWRNEVLALVEAYSLERLVLVGSSMGGWLMLLVALKLGARVTGLVGIAAAPDFTDWGRSAADKAKLRNGETIFDPNPYGPEPTPLHPGFFGDGQGNLLLGDAIAIDCPVRLLHSQRDSDVPCDMALQLTKALRSDDIQVTLVKDGDHRLSREQDIALLLRLVDDVLQAAG